MANKLLFLTGRLAEPRLQRTVAGLGLPPDSWRIANVGVKVAALMTEAIVRNRLKPPLDADRVIVPGRSRMDLEHLRSHYGVPFERGPGRDRRPAAVPRQERPARRICRATICASLPRSSTRRGSRSTSSWRAPQVLKSKGADVIDIGCQPDVKYPHLEETVAALIKAGMKVSVDSGDVEELRRGAKAGADYLLSLDETTLDVVDGTKAVPVLVPKPHGDLPSLVRAIDAARAKGIRAHGRPRARSRSISGS